MMQPKHTGPSSMSFLIRTEWRPHLQNWGRSLLKGKSTLKPAQYLKSSPKPIRDSDRKHFERVLSINEGNDAARAGLGKVLLADGRPDEARRLFSMVANENNTAVGAEAQYLLASSYQENGDFEQALEEYSKVNVLFEAYDVWVAEAQYKTAEIYIREGRRGDALSLLTSIVETYPGTAGAEKAQELLNQNQ